MTEEAKCNLEYTLATHATEHMTPSNEAIRLCKECSEGRLTPDAAVKLIEQKYCVKDECPNSGGSVSRSEE